MFLSELPRRRTPAPWSITVHQSQLTAPKLPIGNLPPFAPHRRPRGFHAQHVHLCAPGRGGGRVVTVLGSHRRRRLAYMKAHLLHQPDHRHREGVRSHLLVQRHIERRETIDWRRTPCSSPSAASTSARASGSSTRRSSRGGSPGCEVRRAAARREAAQRPGDARPRQADRRRQLLPLHLHLLPRLLRAEGCMQGESSPPRCCRTRCASTRATPSRTTSRCGRCGCRATRSSTRSRCGCAALARDLLLLDVLPLLPPRRRR